MKFKPIILTFLGICFSFVIVAQNVPNGGFESWEMRSLYEQPENWITGNQESFMSGEQTVLKVDDAYSGSYAMRLETVANEEDTLFGYAFSNGRFIGGELDDTLFFEGGFPVAATPDSLFGYFKYETAVDDTALVLVSFKSGGLYVGQNVFFLTGTQSDYVKLGFEIGEASATPDTAIIALATTDPDAAKAGGWVQVDSLWFGDTPDVIPNADFETWEEDSYQEPENWVTTNLFSHLFGGGIAASPTADANSGSLALRLEAVEAMVPSDEGLTSMVTGFAMGFESVFAFGEDLPKFSVDFNPESLTGYYKYAAIDDTAMIFVQLYDTEGGEYGGGTILLNADNYTVFTIPLNYPGEVTISEVSVVISTSVHFMESGSDAAEEGAVLYLDDLHLVDPCATFDPYEIASVTQATCDEPMATIDAGEGWDEYLWSNDSTTQVLEMEVSEDLTLTVTVTDSETGCQFSDQVELLAPVGCEDNLKQQSAVKPSFSLYPNPGSEEFNLKLNNIPSGTYKIELISITGKIIQTHTLVNIRNSTQFQMDISSVSNGVYIVKVKGDELNHCERVVINQELSIDLEKNKKRG